MEQNEINNKTEQEIAAMDEYLAQQANANPEAMPTEADEESNTPMPLMTNTPYEVTYTRKYTPGEKAAAVGVLALAADGAYHVGKFIGVKTVKGFKAIKNKFKNRKKINVEFKDSDN